MHLVQSTLNFSLFTCKTDTVQGENSDNHGSY